MDRRPNWWLLCHVNAWRENGVTRTNWIRRFAIGSCTPITPCWENTTLGHLCPANQYQAEKTYMGCYRSKMRLRVHYPPIDRRHCVPGVVQVLAITSYAQAILILLSATVWTVFGGRCLGETIIVCPENFREAIEPWMAYRQRQGHTLDFIESRGTAAEIHTRILQRADRGPISAIVLIGDTPNHANQREPADAGSVPTHYIAARIITPFGGDRMIASDNPYGDLNGDQIADVPIGRLPVDSPEELKNLIDRIIRYESSDDFSLWRGRINLIAGLGGFGGLIDTMIENTTKLFLTSGIPAGYQVSMTRANWKSPYCPDPRLFRDTVIARMNEGCLFWIYMGHGQVQALDQLHVPGATFPILSVEDSARIECDAGAPIVLLFSCYSAAFDHQNDCLAEEMVCSKSGPVAVLGGSRTTMPYAMATLAEAMMDECFRKRTDTLGKIFLRAKKRMIDSQTESGHRGLIDSMGMLFGESAEDLYAQRQEHLHLFNLLGDPLLKIKYPQEIPISVNAIVGEGSEVPIQLEMPIAGQATIELVVRRGQLLKQPSKRLQYDPRDRALHKIQQTYLEANNQQLDSTTQTVAKGPLKIRLKLPPGVVGPCHVRAYIEGAKDFALGTADFYIERSQKLQPEVASGSGRDKQDDRADSLR